LSQESILQLPVELPGGKEISVKDVIPDIIRGNTEYMISVAMKIGFYLTRELPKKERLYLYQISPELSQQNTQISPRHMHSIPFS